MIKLREKSHRYLRIGLYLLDNVKRATVYVTNDCTKRKLLNYICKLYEILSKFTDVYFGYKYPGVINKFAEDCDAEIKQRLCVCSRVVQDYKNMSKCALENGCQISRNHPLYFA